MRLPLNIKRTDYGLNKTRLFNWRPLLVFRHESIWSLLQKFAYWNYLNAASIKSTFEKNAENRGKDSYVTNGKRYDLRSPGTFDPSKLSNILSINQTRINESFVSNYVNLSELNILSSPTFRFCRSCLETGFHSPIHQLLFIQCCPVHNELLLTECFNCRGRIPYFLSNIGFKRPYCCPLCEKPFCEMLSNREAAVPKSINRESMLKSIGDWLISKKGTGNLDSLSRLDISDNVGIQRRDRIVSQLGSLWSNSIEAADQIKCFFDEQADKTKQTVQICVRFVDPNPSKHTHLVFFEKEWDKELFNIYKTIGRHIKKKHLCDHLNCIKQVARATWWGEKTLSCIGKVCIFAHAYILWRMFFEDLKWPSQIIEKRKRTGFYDNRINWRPVSFNYSLIALKKIFAFECYWIFGECLILSKKYFDENTYSFNFFNIKKRCLPYWFITSGINHNQKREFIMNYWLNDLELNDEQHFHNIESLIAQLNIREICPK